MPIPKIFPGVTPGAKAARKSALFPRPPAGDHRKPGPIR